VDGKENGMPKEIIDELPLVPKEQIRKQALELRDKGYNNAEIALKLNMSRSGVTRLFQRIEQGVQAKGSSRIDTPTTRLIIQILNDRQWSTLQLAEDLNVTVRAVERWLKGDREPREEVIKKLKELAKE
jgi:predicted transcriptional regulator